jgi:hypothetical protein
MNDKMEILGSPLGMYSLLRGDYIISVLNDDGSLDEEKLANMAVSIANMGANALRDFFWIDTQEAYEKISPFWHQGEKNFMFNDQFFDNHRRIAQILNRYNLRFYFCAFDHCGTKVSKRANAGEFNPWRFFDNFFYGDDAADLRHRYLDRVFDTFAGLDVGIELCNEPASGQGLFLADTFIYLFKKGFDPEKIIIGIDYHLKESVSAYGKDYRDFRDKIAEELGDKWKQDIKSVCISPVHNADEKGIDGLWRGRVTPGGTRKVLYSMDGVGIPPDGARPDKDMMVKLSWKVLKEKYVAREQGKVLFEVLYGKQSSDPRDSIEGVSEVYKEIWGQYPENWQRWEGVQSLPDTDATETEPPAQILDQPDIDSPRYEKLVTRAYRALLGREPDRGGLEAYVRFLESGGEVREFCRKLVDSEEFKTNCAGLPHEDLARRFYQTILEREADDSGLKHTVEMIGGGKIAQRAAGMLESPEFKKKFS